MSEEQFNPLDVLKRAEDILPSEPTADQRIEVSGYDDWLKNQDIQDPLEGHLGYGDYLREEYVKAEAYNGGIERKIKEELGAALVGKGLLTNENKDEVTSRIDAYGKPDFEKQVRDMVAHTGLEQDDWHNGAAYLAKKDTATPEELESILEQAESSVNRTRNAVLQSKLDSGEIAFARFTSEDGRSYVKAGDAAMQIPMHEALRRSREAGGGVNMADALEIQSTGLLDTPEGMSAPRYKLVQLSELEKLIHAEIKNDPKIAIQVEALGKRMAENDYSSFDHFEEGFRKRVSLPVRKFFENMIGTISDPKPLGTEREEAVDRAMSKDIDETVMEISNKYNKDPDAVRTALQEVVVNNAPMKVFKDESNVGDNIRLDGYGLPYVPAAVKLNDDLFESALEARSDISAATKEALRTERDSFLTTNFVDISKKLTESELSKDWLDHLNKGRKSGLKDRDILSAFTSNPDNRTYADTIFGDLDLGWRDLYRPLTSAFSTVFALGGADWAKEHLKDIAEDNNQRRELAELFGGKLGMAQDLIKLAPEVTVDIGATALLSKFGGRAAATSLAATKAPLYSSMTKKGVLKALTTNAFRRKAGQETADLAENLAAQNLIRNATSKTALDALEAYNKVNLRAITVSSIGLTAANRSAGATYGTVYNQMLKSGASEEDAHDRALGTGMVAGTVTGLITGSFSAFGVGGMEDALLSGMSYRNLKDISNRIIQKADHVSIDGVSDALLQSAIKESAKSVLRKNFFGKGILKAGSAEFAEEALDEFVNTFVTDAGLEQDTPIFDHMKHSLYAGVLGGIMGSAAPVISSAARRVRPDRMREVQEARAYEQRIITDITDRLKEANSEVTADVVKDILEADLYTMPQQEVVTESDIDAETLAETQDAPPETLEEFLSAFNTVSEEDIQEEIESVMGPRLAQMERDVTKEDDQSVFILDEAGEGIVYTNDLVPADKNLTPELSEKLETKPHLLTMDQTLWESYDPEFAALVKDRFKKDKDGKLASPLSEQQQDFVDAKIQEFAAAQRKIVELAAKKGRPIKTPTLGPQPLEDLGLTKEEYFELDRLRMEDRGEVGVVAGTSLGVERIFNTKPVSEQTGDEGIEMVTKFQLITKVTYDSNDTVPFVVAPNAERTVSDDGSVTDIISRGYFSTKKEAQKEAKNVEDVTGLKAEIVSVSVPVKKRKKVEVGDVEVAKVTEYQVFITKKAEPEVEEEVEEEEEEEAEELAPMPEVGETIKYLPYPNAKELETAEVSQITDEGIILVEDKETGAEVEVKLSEIVTDKKEAKRAAKTTRKRTKKPKEPKAELVASFGTQEEANQKVEELRKQYTVEQADIEIKPVKKDRTDFSGVTSGGVPVFEEGGLEQRAEAESATHNDMLNRIKELGKKLNDPVKVRDGKKPLLTFKEAREKLIELLDKKNDKEAKAERKEQRDAFEEIEDTYEKAIQQAEFDFEVGDINAALLEIEKKAALTSRYQKLVKLRRNKKAQDLLKEAQRKQAEGTPLLIKGRGNTLREGQIIKDKNGNLQLKPLRGRDKNPITPVDVNGNIYLVTSKIDPITKQKVWHEFGRQDVGANYNTKEKFIQYLKYGPKDAPSKMPWEGLRLSAEESAEVGAIANYGLPPAGLSQTKRFGITKQRKAKGFYPSLNRAITKRIYQLYPVLPVSRPTNGSVITAVDKVTGYSPWAEVTSEKGRVVKGKKRKDPNLFPAQPTSYRPKAFVYKNGVGVFDNDPIAMSVLLGKHPIIIPDSFTGRINKAFRYQRIDGDLVVTDIVGVGANGVAQSMKRKKETTIPFSRVALDKEAGFLGLFKSLSLFRNDKTGKTAEVENPNGAGITTVEDLLNDLNDIIENAGKVNLEEEARLSDRKRIAGMKLGEDATIEDQQNALESIGYSSKRAAAEIERLRQDIRITQDQILIAETREESDRLNEVLSARQGELGVALIEFSNSVIPAAKILAVADENVKDNLDRYTKAEGEVKSLQRRIDELADTEKKINKLGKSGSVSKFVFGIGELKAEIQNDPNNQDLVDRLAALEKEAQANKKYQEYEAARKKYLDLLDDKANKNIADQIANAQERQTLQLEGLHRAVLAKEKVIAGGSVAATRDPFAAKKYLDRILSSRRSGKIEEEFRGDAEAALRTEYELHALMFQLRQDMRPFVDSDGNLRGVMELKKVGDKVEAAKSTGKVPVDLEAKQGRLKKSVEANRAKAISILLSRIDHPLIAGPTAKKTAKGAIAKEAKQEFAVVLNNLADLGMDNAGVNYVEVYSQFIEKLFINGPTYWARGDTLPSFEAVGQRVANNILKQQARRNVRNRNKKLYGQDSIPYPDVEERLSEEERLSGEDKGQSLFFRHFISYDLKQDELLFLIDDLQQDVINILENNPEIRRAFDTLLKEGPFIEMPDFNPAELSAESAWAEMVAYVRQASIGETLGVEGPEGATGAAGVEGGSAVTIDGQLVRRKIATGNVAPLAFLKKLEKGSTPEAQAIKRAFRIYRMADFEFSRDPFKIANPENIAGLKETLADPTVSAEEKSEVTEQLSEVDDALEYTNWLKDEIRYQLAHRVDGNLDLPSELRETILTFQAQNVHKAINEMQARSFFSKSQFAKAIDVAVAGTVNNRNILRLGLDNTSESVLKAMDKIYASEPKEYQRKMARLFGSDQPNAGFVRGVRFQLGLIDNSYASKTEVLADGRIGVTLNAKGWNGRGVTDTLIRSFLHAKLLHNLKSAELTEKQQAAKGKIEATLKALRKKFGGNTQPVMRSGTKSLKDFVDHIFDSSDFQSALKVRLSKKGMPSFDQTLNSLLILTDQRAEVNGDAKFKKSFKDMVDLAGFTYSSPTTPAGVRDEAVTHAGQALAEHDNVHRILGSRLKKQNEEKELSEEDKKELSERANLLAAVAMSRVPAEIEVVMTSIPNGKVAAFDMVSGQLLFDPRNAAIATLERGMDRVSSQGMIGRVIREEMAHKSAKAALTAGMVKAVMDASSDVDYQNDIDAYYGEGTPEAEAAASRLKDPSSEVAFKEKERLVQERLAALTQKIMDGQTTEDAEAFFAANPSTLSIAIFYIKKFINGFIRAFSDGTKGLKPEERIAVNRMLVELRGLEMGYRMPRRMDPKAGPEETALQFLKTVGAEPTEEDDTIKVDKTTLPQEMPSGLESGVGGTFVVEGDEDVAYMEAVEAGDTKTAKEILVKATDKITVDSFRQLAHTVTLQRMGVGSLLRAQQEYDKKQEKLAELEPVEDASPSKEYQELKKFFDDKDALQQQLFDMWEEKTKVGPKHLEIIVRDKDGNIIPLSQRLGFDVNVTKVEETSQVLEPRVPIQEFDESGAPITGLPKFREELSLSELQSLLENEEEGSDRIPLIESAIERIESEMRDREKTSRPQPDGDALLKMFASELGLKVDATIDKGGVLYSGFGARRRRGDTDFNAFNFDYEQLFSQFEMPVLEVDDLKIEKGFKGLMKKHLVGLLQPEIHHWMKHRQALKKTVATELKMAQVQLRGLIEQVYPDGSVPVDPDGLTIIQKATGSTEGVFLSDAVSARLDKDLNDAKKAAWLNAHTQSQQAGADIKQIQKDQRDAVNAAKAKYESDIKAELVNRRAEIVAERDAARTRIAKDSKELLVALINLRKLADKFTNKLEAIHKESVIKGTTGKYDVKISDNNGIYLTRTYKIFLDVGYADAVRKNPEYQEERDAAIAFFEKTHLENEEGKLRMEHPAKTDAEIKQMAKDNMVGRKIGERALEAFISSYEMKGSGDAYMSAQESIKSMVDNLKAKKNIPKPLRDILGEQKDKTTPDNLLRTIMTVGSMAANQSFLNSIAKAGLDKGWLVTEEEFNSNRDKYVDPETNKEWQRVVQHTSDRQYNPLSGLYGRPELAGAFAETFKEYGTSYANDSEKLMAGSFRYFQKLTGYSMASKTLGSTGFYMRNAISNIAFFGPMQMGGVGNLMLLGDYGKNFVTELKRAHKGDRAKLDDELAKLRSLRIIGDESRTNTMRQLMLGERSLEEVEQDFISRLEDAEGAVGKAKEKAGQGVEYLSRMAAAMDAFFKIAYYKNELKVLEKAYANELSSLSPEDRATRMSQIEKEAASKVLRTTQAYSEAPPLVRALQRSVWGSFLAPFVRFKADVIRVMYNTVKVAMEERASGNAVLIKRGNQRLRGFAFTIGGLSFLVPLLLRMIFGVGEEEDEAYKAAGPKWARHNTLWYRRKKNGELEAWNLTFLNPFSTVMDGVNSAVLGEFFGGGSLDSAIEVGLSAVFVDQFLDDQIFSSALKEAFVKGVDDTTGKRVWIEGVDTGVNKLLKQLHHTWNKGFEPRVWTKMEAAWKASKGDYTELEYSPMGIIFNEFKPVRSRTVKPDQLLKQYIFKMEQARSQIREKFRPLYNKNVSVSEDEIFDIYDEVYEGLKDINKDIIRKMGGFEGLGLSKADIYKISRGTGGGPKMGKRRTELLMNGYMEKPVLSANKVAIMMKEAETDPKMAERLRIFVEAAKRYDRFSKIDD
jgi:hypothetical protein